MNELVHQVAFNSHILKLYPCMINWIRHNVPVEVIANLVRAKS